MNERERERERETLPGPGRAGERERERGGKKFQIVRLRSFCLRAPFMDKYLGPPRPHPPPVPPPPSYPLLITIIIENFCPGDFPKFWEDCHFFSPPHTHTYSDTNTHTHIHTHTYTHTHTHTHTHRVLEVGRGV